MRMRGGCICDESVADIYDANRDADLAMAKKLLPKAAEVWVEDGMIMFKIEAKDDTWFGSFNRRDPQWFKRRIK